MKITPEGIEAIKANLNCRNRLTYEMKVHSRTIERQVNANEENGPLTTEVALRIISEETTLTRKELLTKD